ncbi:hypothetical protein B7494_g535 [Chlorociboria aeruginascens]|nr:hypothetical protein B7494_g535 [Chlorociboria aeruginascens]
MASLGLLKRITDEVSQHVRSGDSYALNNVMASSGIAKRLRKVVFKHGSATSRRSRIIQIAALPTMIALILCIVGGIDASNSDPSDVSSSKSELKAGIAIFLVIYILLFGLVVITMKDFGNAPHGEKRIFFADIGTWLAQEVPRMSRGLRWRSLLVVCLPGIPVDLLKYNKICFNSAKLFIPEKLHSSRNLASYKPPFFYDRSRLQLVGPVLFASAAAAMGRIADLLSTGLELAIEAASTPKSSSNSNPYSQSVPSTQRYRSSEYGTLSLVKPTEHRRSPPGHHSVESEREAQQKYFQQLQDYADFQDTLSANHQDSHMLGLQSSLSSLPRKEAIHHDVQDYAYEVQDPRNETIVRSLQRPIVIPRRHTDGQSSWDLCYSPTLMHYGIDSFTFTNFLRSFNRVCSSASYLDVINIASLGIRSTSEISPAMLSTVALAAANLAKSIQETQRPNNFLNQANHELFVPGGLYAMIATYDPENYSQICTVDISASHAQSPLDISSGSAEISFPRGNPHNSEGFGISSHPTSELLSILGSKSTDRLSRDERRNGNRAQSRRHRRRSRSGRSGGLLTTVLATAIASTQSKRTSDITDVNKVAEIRNINMEPGHIYLIIVNNPIGGRSFTTMNAVYHPSSGLLHSPTIASSSQTATINPTANPGFDNIGPPPQYTAIDKTNRNPYYDSLQMREYCVPTL